jgi:hypothetical protein
MQQDTIKLLTLIMCFLATSVLVVSSAGMNAWLYLLFPTFIHLFPSYAKLRDHKLLKHSALVDPAKMQKSKKYVVDEQSVKESAGVVDEQSAGVVDEQSVKESACVVDEQAVKESAGLVDEQSVKESAGKLDEQAVKEFRDCWMDDDISDTPNDLLEEDYEGGWGEEDYDPEFDKQLRS